MLKLARVLRLGKIITYLNLKDDVKMSLKLGKLIFFLIIYIHINGCIWYMIVSSDKIWVPPMDFSYVTTEMFEKPLLHQYLMSLYHSTLSLTGNDLGPRNSMMLFYVSSLITMGAIINANLFGELAVIVNQMN